MIAWISVCKGQSFLQYENYPTSGPKTIKVNHVTYVEISGKLKCPLVIKSATVGYFVKVEIEDLDINYSHYLSILDIDTSKLYKYTFQEASPFVPPKFVSTELEVQQARINATLKITPWPLQDMDTYQSSSKITVIQFGSHAIAIKTMDRLNLRKVQRNTILSIQIPNDSWCNDTKYQIVALEVEDAFLIQLFGKLKCNLLIRPTHPEDKIKVELIAKNYKKHRFSISFWTRQEEYERFHLNRTQDSIFLDPDLNAATTELIVSELRIEDIDLRATLTITPLTQKHSKKFGNLKIIVIPSVFGIFAIILFVWLLISGQKTQNQVVCVVSLSNLQNNVVQAEVRTNAAITLEDSSNSILRQASNVRTVARSLPSYSECEFNQNNPSEVSSTNQEPPSFEEALKLNWI